MACSPGSNPVAPFDTLSSTPFFNGIGAGYNFVLGGVGTRDIDTNSTPASLILNVPGTVLNAYLYVNTLDANPGSLASVDFKVNAGGFTSLTAAPPYNFGMIGWCNDTCWLAEDDGSHHDGASSNNQNIYNHVFWADVTSLVLSGTNTYSFRLPGITRGASRAFLSSDNAYYPGCTGSQGIALLVVYDDGSGISKNVKVFHGAKLLDPDPGTWGGSTSHTITFNASEYLAEAKVAVGVGDAQTQYSDSFCFNGSCIPQNAFASAVNPIDGNLLQTYTLLDTCALPTNNNAIMSAAGGTECICWFLFVYNAATASCGTPDHGLMGALGNSGVAGSPFIDLTGQFDYVTGGVGTRKLDLDVEPGVFSVYVPGVPLQAYLYWNVLVADTVDASNAILNGNTKAGTRICYVGDTCWSSQGFCPEEDIGYDPGIKTSVWRANVIADVLGAIPIGGTYNASVTVPNVHTGNPISFLCDDTHFPGCSGSQGIVLLIVYQTVCGTDRRVLVYDGGVQIIPTASIPAFGGVNQYTLSLASIAPEFAGCARITTGMGDAECSAADEFQWNGSPLPPFCNCPDPAFATPTVGEAMSLRDDFVEINAGINTAFCTTTQDCLCWFLFAVTAYPLICAPTDCGPNACHGAVPEDQLYFFERRVGNIDFVLGGVGIRDFDTNITPAVINITVPGPVIKAYLYWNTIGGGDNCPDEAVFNGTPIPGDIIGCCGNTCWSAWCAVGGSDHTSDDTLNNNLMNKVWFHDVTSLVPGSGSYAISIPEVHPSGVISINSSDTPNYPGCCSGQGIALLVIYQTDPVVITRPSHTCPPKGQAGCVPDFSRMVVETETREILVWHGGKLLICDGCIPDTVDGSNEYSVSWKTKYTWKTKIATAVGDAQSKYRDSFSYNGIILPPEPSYFNPYAGNLLHIKTENLPSHITKCDCGPNGQENIVTAFTPDDCLCWFLFVYSGVQKCVAPTVSNVQNFVSPPMLQNFASPPKMTFNLSPPEMTLENASSPLHLPCCGNTDLPTKLNIGITAPPNCSCLANTSYKMNWDKNQKKYILSDQLVCGCTLFGWLYCVGHKWTLYLALSSGDQLCSDGMNDIFPIHCKPFGGNGPLALNFVNACGCSCGESVVSLTRRYPASVNTNSPQYIGLENWWPLDQPSGQSTQDLIGNFSGNFAGTELWATDPQLTYAWNPSIVDKKPYLLFDVTINNNWPGGFAPVTGAPFSITMWVYPIDGEAITSVLLRTATDPFSMIQAQFVHNNLSGHNAQLIMLGTDSVASSIIAQNALVPNTWNHIAFVYDGNQTLATSKAYVNGINNASISGGPVGNFAWGNNDSLTLFSNESSEDPQTINTRVADVRIYNRVLSQSDVNAMQMGTGTEWNLYGPNPTLLTISISKG